MPVDVCGAVVKRELEFWGISDTKFELCCLTDYVSYLENKKNLVEFNATLSTDGAPLSPMKAFGWRKLQHDVWMILEYPQSSILAMVRYLLMHKYNSVILSTSIDTQHSDLAFRISNSSIFQVNMLVETKVTLVGCV